MTAIYATRAGCGTAGRPDRIAAAADGRQFALCRGHADEPGRVRTPGRG